MAYSLALDAQSHIRYAKRCLMMLPTAYMSEDCSRLSLAFFALSTLDVLGAIDTLSHQHRTEYIEWIYAQQVTAEHGSGFRGGPHVGLPGPAVEPPHLVMTYTAVLCLGMLGDDLARLDIASIKRNIAACQGPDGSFAPYPGSDERDVRFTYCAAVLCHVLKCEEVIDTEAATRYVLRCRSYDYAFGQKPGLESQGGSTYCAISALHLLGRLDVLPHAERTLSWLLHRRVPMDLSKLDLDDMDLPPQEQQDLLDRFLDGSLAPVGYQGRPEKVVDACYQFWVGASIRLLLPNAPLSHDVERERHFLYLCQSRRMGGLAKHPGEYSDIYHTYLGLAALALTNHPSMRCIDPGINITHESLSRLRVAISHLAPEG